MAMSKRTVNSMFFSLSLSPFCGREESLQKRWETPKITCHKAFFFRLYPGVGVNGCLFQDAELFEHSFREHSLWWTGGAEEDADRFRAAGDLSNVVPLQMTTNGNCCQYPTRKRPDMVWCSSTTGSEKKHIFFPFSSTGRPKCCIAEVRM